MIPIAVPAPIVHEAPAQEIDYGRVLRCIQAVEKRPWNHHGGALGFTTRAWAEDSPGLPFQNSSDKEYAYIVGERRLKRAVVWLEARGYDPTVVRLGMAWRFGFAGSVGATEYYKDADYGERVSNLYFDKTFSP